MALSVFDLFSIGIGPSSSHVVGPMRAVGMFIDRLREDGQLQAVQRVRVDLYGSLAHTGKGHGTDVSIALGLLGEAPETIDTTSVAQRIQDLKESNYLLLGAEHPLCFTMREDIVFHFDKQLPLHSNGLEVTAFSADGMVLCQRTYYSVGGGFVRTESDIDGSATIEADTTQLPYPFSTSEKMLQLCKEHGLSIAAVMLCNEQQWNSKEQIREQLLRIWEVMKESIDHGIRTEGVLPGHLRVQRRAPQLYQKLKHQTKDRGDWHVMDWVNLYAIAINEENAAGGRVVTAPTNGAAGIVPAVLKMYMEFHDGDEDSVVQYLLTAAAVGILFKENASISGAEVGCQGEVGSACSMASAGLCALMGGSPEQIENAAEIAIEHNLGLTCDPVGGLVQIPCIERNAMGSVKAINAARMAMQGNGEHYVSLDKAIITMRDTGKDMLDKYKETARGGLAVNIVEC